MNMKKKSDIEKEKKMTIFSQSYNMVCAVRTFGAHQNCSAMLHNFAYTETVIRNHGGRAFNGLLGCDYNGRDETYHRFYC